MPRYSLSPVVEPELDDIWYYVAKESGSSEIANRLIDSITARFSLLARFPEVGRRRDADIQPGVRSFPVGEYVILYRVSDDAVQILHVFHGKRDVFEML